MKIIVAPDSFKGSVSAEEAALSIKRGLLEGVGDTHLSVLCLPIADGGEGTLAAIVPTKDRRTLSVSGPDFVKIEAEYGTVGKIAVVEMATAAGLTILPPEKRSAMRATTYGVGELIERALLDGAKEILLTVGGSATNDGGCGMIAALGARFLDENGKEFIPTGGTLSRICDLDLSNLSPLLKKAKITVATDVKNPLIGENGATYIYARQKGASDEELKEMEAGMQKLARLLADKSGRDVASIEGAGAGGGISVPLLAFTEAHIQSGIEAVLDALSFEEALQDASLVITGEGKIDRQSLFGKAISGVARAAGKVGIPVDCFVGCIGDDPCELRRLGVRDLYAVADRAASPADSMKNAAYYLYEMAKEYARKL